MHDKNVQYARALVPAQYLDVESRSMYIEVSRGCRRAAETEERQSHLHKLEGLVIRVSKLS